MLNGFLAPILIGVAVATFFTGGAYHIDKMNIVSNGACRTISYWDNPYHGLECIANQFNLLLGLVFLFSSMTLGSMYYMWNFSVPIRKSAADIIREEFGDTNPPSAEIEAKRLKGAEESLKRMAMDRKYLAGKAYKNMVPSSIIFLILFIVFVLDFGIRSGYAVDPASGLITPEHSKYLHNLTQLVWPLVFLCTGTALAIFGIFTRICKAKWFSAKASFLTTGLGITLAVFSLLACAALNNTAFFPSTVAIQDSLTLQNASSSLVTLKTMSYVSLLIPIVIAYIGVTWHKLAGTSKGY
jgi:cytochrome d ubiquinol oxidase subunit II